MASDDVIYMSLLFLTIAFGYIFRLLGTREKELFGSLVGVSIVVFVSGSHSIHPLIVTLFTILLLQFGNKKYVHIVAFAVLFSYLLLFRLCHYIQIPTPPAHTNAIQMILTLKMVGLCFEVHDVWKKEQRLKSTESEEEKSQIELDLKYEGIDPSAVDVFHYAFVYVGVLTGPYYKFRTYQDMIQNSFDNGSANFVSATLKRLKFVPLYCILFLIFNHYFPLKFAESTQIFRDYSFLYRVFYMTPVFFTFRMRIYTGFVLSECACIMAGLGCYPKEGKNRPGAGPSDYQALENLSSNKDEASKEVDFEAIHNIDEYGSEFSPTVRTGMRAWNMTVQYWLVRNVYKRLNTPKAMKEATTMLVSAFWHGVYSGYYLSMLTVPFILAVEDYYDKIVKQKLSQAGQTVYDWVIWIHKMQQFSYMGMGFLLLRVDSTMFYWRSIGFIYHGLIIFMHAIGQYVNLILYKADKKLAKSSKTAVIGNTRVMVVRHEGPNKTGDSNITEGDIIDVSNLEICSDPSLRPHKD